MAVVARSSALTGVGVDIEPMEILDDEVMAILATDEEYRGLQYGAGKTLFSIKEAVFKAVNPYDRVFLDFKDVVVDFSSRVATTSYGRRVSWRVITEHRVMAVAWW